MQKNIAFWLDKPSVKCYTTGAPQKADEPDGEQLRDEPVKNPKKLQKKWKKGIDKGENAWYNGKVAGTKEASGSGIGLWKLNNRLSKTRTKNVWWNLVKNTLSNSKE